MSRTAISLVHAVWSPHAVTVKLDDLDGRGLAGASDDLVQKPVAPAAMDAAGMLSTCLSGSYITRHHSESQ
jgi:hypothetical protein